MKRLVLVFFLFSMRCLANNVPVQNPSFESPLLTGGQSSPGGFYVSDSIPGWVLHGNLAYEGIWLPHPNYLVPSDGQQVAWVGYENNITQDVGTQAGTLTLTVAIGHRSDNYIGTVAIRLMSGTGTIICSQTIDEATIPSGTMKDFACSGSANSDVIICLETIEGSQGDFDNVRLVSDAPTAEMQFFYDDSTAVTGTITLYQETVPETLIETQELDHEGIAATKQILDPTQQYRATLSINGRQILEQLSLPTPASVSGALLSMLATNRIVVTLRKNDNTVISAKLLAR